MNVQKDTIRMNRRDVRRRYIRANRKFEAIWSPRIRKAIHSTVQPVIDELRENGYGAAINKANALTTNMQMAATISRMYAHVGLYHARVTDTRIKQEIRRYKKGLSFSQIWADWIKEYLRYHLLDKITLKIAQTTSEALLKALFDGQQEGLGIDGMIERLEDWPYERFQAARIARTEVNRASNVGSKAQEETSEYEQQKEWISVLDFRTRGHNPKDHANHAALNGTRIDSGDVFVDPRNGDRLDFPGDPKAKAESTINCRCQSAYMAKRDDRGRLIPKRKTTTVIFPGQRRQVQTITI